MPGNVFFVVNNALYHTHLLLITKFEHFKRKFNNFGYFPVPRQSSISYFSNFISFASKGDKSSSSDIFILSFVKIGGNILCDECYIWSMFIQYSALTGYGVYLSVQTCPKRVPLSQCVFGRFLVRCPLWHVNCLYFCFEISYFQQLP